MDCHKPFRLWPGCPRHLLKIIKVGVSNGSTTHLAVAWLSSLADIKISYIPYKITTQIVSDTISGQVELLIANVLPTTPHVKSGRLRALAVTSAQR